MEVYYEGIKERERVLRGRQEKGVFGIFGGQKKGKQGQA